MSVAQDIQRAMNTTVKQVMADAPYDKSRTGMVVDYDEATNTYSVIVDRVTYEKIPIVNGLKANVNDIVKVVYPTNNISQMYINSICPLDKIKFYLPIDATEIITPNLILYDNIRKSSIGSNATTTSVGWDWENNDGASLSLRSADKVGQEGEFTLHAKNATNYTALTGTPAGLLRWKGNLQLGNPSNNKEAGATVSDNATSFDVGWNWDRRDGAMLALRSVDYTTGNEGAFSLVARDGTNSRALTGYPSGGLNWGGTPISLQGHTHTNQIKNLTQRIVSFKGTAANTWQYNGVSFTIPSGHLYLVRPTLSWNTGKPIGVGFDSSSAVGSSGFPAYNFENANGFYVPPVFMLYTGTYYMFEKRASTPTTANTTYVNFVDINFGAIT